MSKLKTVVRCIIFFIIGFIIFHMLTIIFVPKWVGKIDPATPRWKEFYEQEEDTIDVLLVGASDVGRGLSPITLWEEHGITSFNLGTSNQSMAFSYYVIEEAIKYQDIKVVVLDMDSTFMNVNPPEGEYRKLFDNMKFGKTKIKAIQEPDLEADNKLSYLFPLLRFHSRWDKLEQNDFSMRKKHQISYKGMALSAEIKPYIDNKKYMAEKNETEQIKEINLKYIDKIVNLCRENNIQLLMIEIPSASSWSKARGEAVEKLAKEYNIEFIDMNLLLKEMEFDWKTDTADKGNHLNIMGAEKVTKYLGNILSQRYNCVNHKNDMKYNSWNEEKDRYEKAKKVEHEKYSKKD